MLAALAAACAQQARAPRGPAPLQRPVPPPPPTTTQAPEPPPPPEAPRNRVALLVPTSGPSAAVGQSIANAASMAFVDVGAARFSLQTYDTAAGGARAAAERAVADGAGVILGPLLAADARAVAPVSAGAGVPVFSFTNDASVAGGGTYVLGFQPTQSIARVIGFAEAKGVHSFAALVPAGVYGARASTAFLRTVQAGGGAVTGVVTYTRDRKQLALAARKVTAYDTRLTRAGPGGVGGGGAPVLRPDGTVAPVASRLGGVPFQALMIADSGSLAGAFGPALAQYGAGGAKILGTELWASEPALGNSGALRGAWFATVPEARFQKLAARYRAKNGGRPSRLASLGYDAVLLVQSQSARWQVGSPFPRDGLADPGGFTGVDGVFRFTPNGVAERALEVRQVAAGGAVVVSPAPTGFGGR